MWPGLGWVVLLLVLQGVTFVIRVITAQMGMEVPRWIHSHAWLHLAGVFGSPPDFSPFLAG